jgi:hypothetical protein
LTGIYYQTIDRRQGSVNVTLGASRYVEPNKASGFKRAAESCG